mmetsp:Transcript_8849/g.28488  ORF Transcript_8849/g.28488 Transcript_8849/m.28488 type:complete len:200 (+) Transcript_8849:2268-2867(+)
MSKNFRSTVQNGVLVAVRNRDGLTGHRSRRRHRPERIVLRRLTMRVLFHASDLITSDFQRFCPVSFRTWRCFGFSRQFFVFCSQVFDIVVVQNLRLFLQFLCLLLCFCVLSIGFCFRGVRFGLFLSRELFDSELFFNRFPFRFRLSLCLSLGDGPRFSFSSRRRFCLGRFSRFHFYSLIFRLRSQSFFFRLCFRQGLFA